MNDDTSTQGIRLVQPAEVEYRFSSMYIKSIQIKTQYPSNSSLLTLLLNLTQTCEAESCLIMADLYYYTMFLYAVKEI